ncbi:unnamed protein product [Musa acuminata subsp. burmannicoides]
MPSSPLLPFLFLESSLSTATLHERHRYHPNAVADASVRQNRTISLLHSLCYRLLFRSDVYNMVWLNFFQLRVVVKGRVQGVFFRDWTVQTARELGLNGWVRNRRDGSVEALFSGDPTAVDEMVERRCRVGPPAAVVTALSAFPSEDDPGQGFQRKPTV